MQKLVLFSLFISISFSAISQVTKRVLLEEASYASCAQCPEGAYWADSIHKEFSNVVVVTHHIYQDSMTIQESIDWAADMSSGAPLANIDRVDFTSNGTTYELTTQWRDKVIQQLATTADVEVSLSGSYNTSTNQLNLSVTAEFVNSVNAGDLRLNVFLIEDSVTGTGPGYDQANIYNTQTGHPYFGAGDPIVGFVHRHVVRDFITGTWGDDSVIPSSPATSTPYTGTYNYTVPQNYDEDQLSVVAFVSYYHTNVTQREVLNANQEKLSNLTGSSIAESTGKDIFQISPNPSTGLMQLNLKADKCEILNNIGQVLLIENNCRQVDLSYLPNGNYIAKVTLNGNEEFKKLILAK